MQKSLAFQLLENRLKPNVRNAGQRILDALGAAGAILLVDEFSVFLRSALDEQPEEMKVVSEILAQSRQAPKPTRQVLAGSTGLSTFLHFYGLDKLFEDLGDVTLEPLDSDWAAVLAEELLYGAHQTPTPDVVKAILAEVGAPVPYFIHGLISMTRDRGDVTVETVRQAYHDDLLGSLGRDSFSAYRLATQLYPKDLVKPAVALLRALAESPEGLPEMDLQQLFVDAGADASRFSPLLSCLQEDYDLVDHDGRWTMRSKVLRERWSLREPWLTAQEI